MASIAERARSAAQFVHHHATTSPYGRYRGGEQALTAVRLAALLGIGLDRIAVQPDALRRRTTCGEPLLATVTCPHTGEQYVFLARHPLYEDDSFELLGSCPECAARVPLAEIRHLADLGTHLTSEDTPTAETFALDEGHTADCQYGEALA